MRKTKPTSRTTKKLSHGQAWVVRAEQEKEYASTFFKETRVIPNRWNVEAKKNQPIMNNQVTSEFIVFSGDLGSEEFTTGSASSQIGPAKFHETRILSFSTLKRRAEESLKQAEQKRQEILIEEVNISEDE